MYTDNFVVLHQFILCIHYQGLSNRRVLRYQELKRIVHKRLDQYEIGKFAESFEMIPKTLAENAELNAMEITSTLYADHANGNVKVGTDLEEGACKDG
ncbi:hypothetical protein Lser_V15G06109 [Lactuca serriola]